jgi:hypothetical protein
LRILSERWVEEEPVEEPVEEEPEEPGEMRVRSNGGYFETYYEYQRVAFLLNPGSSQVPEPGATVAVAGVVALLAAWAAIRRRQRRR